MSLFPAPKVHLKLLERFASSCVRYLHALQREGRGVFRSVPASCWVLLSPWFTDTEKRFAPSSGNTYYLPPSKGPLCPVFGGLAR